MSLRALCLFVAIALVSAGDPVLDESDVLKVKAFRPGETNNEDGTTLKMRCSFDLSKTNFVSLTKLKFYTSAVADGFNFRALGSLDADDVSYGLTRKEITVDGRYRVDPAYRSKLEVTWVSADSGYCTIYSCVATGRDPNNGKLLAIYKNLQVDAADGGSCP